MIPGRAKSRLELPWLPYPKQDQMYVINAHNFGVSFDADAAAYFAAVEAVSDFDLTALDSWATPNYVKTKINDFVVGLKSDGVWSAMLNSSLFIGPRTSAGAFVKLRGSTACSVLNGSFTYNARQGLINAASSRLTTGENAGGTQNDAHAVLWTHTSYTSGNGRYLDAGDAIEIIASASSLVRIRGHSTTSNSPSSSSFSDGMVGFSRSNSSNYTFVAGASSGTVTQASTANFANNVWLFGDAANFLPVSQTISMFSTGTSADLTKIRDRFATLKSALTTFTP